MNTTNHPITETGKKIIAAALTTNSPTSIAKATQLAVITVLSGIKSLQSHNLAVYDKEHKVLHLTEEGIQAAKGLLPEPVAEKTAPIVAGDPAAVPNDVEKIIMQEPVIAQHAGNTFVITGGTNKARAWVIIEAMMKANARGEVGNRRKDIVKVLAAEFNIKQNAASQYIQHYRKAHGMVKSKMDVVADVVENADPTGVTPNGQPAPQTASVAA